MNTIILRILNFIYGKSSCMHEVFVVKSKLHAYRCTGICIVHVPIFLIVHLIFFQILFFQYWWYKWIEKNLYSIICFYYLQRIASLLFLWVVLYWKARLMKLISNSGQTSWFVDYYDYMYLIRLQLLVLFVEIQSYLCTSTYLCCFYSKYVFIIHVLPAHVLLNHFIIPNKEFLECI